MVMGIIRAGPDFKKFGDPYVFSASVIIQDKEAYIMGASGVFTRQLFFDIKFQLGNMGIKKVHWDRMKTKPKHVELKIGDESND